MELKPPPTAQRAGIEGLQIEAEAGETRLARLEAKVAELEERDERSVVFEAQRDERIRELQARMAQSEITIQAQKAVIEHLITVLTTTREVIGEKPLIGDYDREYLLTELKRAY